MSESLGGEIGDRGHILHHDNPSFMQLLDHFLRRDANGTDKQLRFAGDDDIHELAELAVSIIVLRVPVKTQNGQATPE